MLADKFYLESTIYLYNKLDGDCWNIYDMHD